VDENAIGERVIGCALAVHKALGPGLLESAYEACLAHELAKAGLEVKRQLALPLVYDGMQIEAGYRLDLLVADLVVVEIKTVDALAAIHRAQLLSYLKLGGYRLGYLLNFNVRMLKDGVLRLANGL
jgi:GxxExxY protein